MMAAQDPYGALEKVKEFRNMKTIVIGEVNTGKTAYLGQILDRFLEGGETEITVIDMAPESVKGIGGKMSVRRIDSIRYYTEQIVAPRLMGRSVDEIENLAENNAKLIEGIFVKYLKAPGKVLFINDVSIYLQRGKIDKLLLLLNSTPTVIMNGYYGVSLGGGKLGERERQNMEALQKRCDKVIKLPLSSFQPPMNL